MTTYTLADLDTLPDDHVLVDGDVEGGGYLRISDDREGLERGVERQFEDVLSLARESRVRLRKRSIFLDNDRGASDLSKKPRPDFQRMIRGIKDGSIRVVLSYSNSRLTRRPRELEDLIDLHREHGIEYKTKVSGDDDLSTAEGRMVARIKGNVDAAEAEKTGERVRRARKADAQAGKVWRSMSGRVFGWEDDLITEHPIEGELIRQAASDLLTGRRSLTQIAKDWNEAGVTTTRGKLWSPAQVTQLLRSPRLIGLRVHQGQVALDRTGVEVRGPWDAILSREDWDRLGIARKANSKSPRKARRGRRQYMLSRYARCGICAEPMSGMRIKDNYWNYFCGANPATRDHTNTVSGRAVDRIVAARVVLKSQEQASMTFEAPDFAGAARLAEVTDALRDTMARIRSGTSKIPSDVLWAQAEELGAEKEALEVDAQQYYRSHEKVVKVRMLELEDFWAMGVPEQQAHIETLVGPVLIQPPRVTRTGSRFDETRVQFPRDRAVALSSTSGTPTPAAL